MRDKQGRIMAPCSSNNPDVKPIASRIELTSISPGDWCLIDVAPEETDLPNSELPSTDDWCLIDAPEKPGLPKSKSYQTELASTGDSCLNDAPEEINLAKSESYQAELTSTGNRSLFGVDHKKIADDYVKNLTRGIESLIRHYPHEQSDICDSRFYIQFDRNKLTKLVHAFARVNNYDVNEKEMTPPLYGVSSECFQSLLTHAIATAVKRNKLSQATLSFNVLQRTILFKNIIRNLLHTQEQVTQGGKYTVLVGKGLFRSGIIADKPVAQRNNLPAIVPREEDPDSERYAHYFVEPSAKRFYIDLLYAACREYIEASTAHPPISRSPS